MTIKKHIYQLSKTLESYYNYLTFCETQYQQITLTFEIKRLNNEIKYYKYFDDYYRNQKDAAVFLKTTIESKINIKQLNNEYNYRKENITLHAEQIRNIRPLSLLS